MSKLTNTAVKPGNGKPSPEEKAILSVVQPVKNPQENKPEDKKPAEEPKKELTLMEKILKVENLQLIVEKRAKLVQTRSELERFQVSSNDFNCTMRLNDSDGNVFTTNFTPGVKKVIEFLKTSFDNSISEVEMQIQF